VANNRTPMKSHRLMTPPLAIAWLSRRRRVLPNSTRRALRSDSTPTAPVQCPSNI